MSIYLWTGMPGSGKSSELADHTLALLRRNQRFYVRQVKAYAKALDKGIKAEELTIPVKRPVYSNVILNNSYQHYVDNEFLIYYYDLVALVTVRDSDIVCQEISQYIDSQEFEKLPRRFKGWLRKHRHYGLDIYGDTQDFLTVDISFRRLVNNVYYCQKLVGSSDPSPTRPVVKFIWGITMIREIDPSSFDKEKEKYQFKTMSFQFRLISRARCMVYDTRQDVPAPDWPALVHVERYCNDPSCPQYGKKPHISHK